MDVLLEELLQQVKDRVEVLAGENPIMRIADAIRLAERNDILYRYAQNGGTYEVRWFQSDAVHMFMESELPLLICKKIIEKFPSKSKDKTPAVLDGEAITEIQKPKQDKPKPTSTSKPKSTSTTKGQTKNTAKPPK